MARYRAIDIRIWFDDKFPNLSDDSKLLFFYCLTNPRGTMLGISVQGQADISEFLHWPLKRLREPFAELLRERLIFYDENTRTLYLPNFLKYNPLDNENQAKAAAKCLDEIPVNCPYLQDVKQFIERLAKPFLEPLAKRLGQRYAKQGSGSVSEEVSGEEEGRSKAFLSDSIEIGLSSLLFDLIKLRNPKHKPPNLQLWAKQIDLMIRVDKRDPKEIRKVIEASQADPFWQNNILSPEKLRKQYDQLVLKL